MILYNSARFLGLEFVNTVFCCVDSEVIEVIYSKGSYIVLFVNNSEAADIVLSVTVELNILMTDYTSLLCTGK